MVPYSLGIQRSYEYNAPIYPFPSFEDNQNPPDGLYSAASTRQDNCGNLWILDNGIKNIATAPPAFPAGLFAYSFSAQRITYKYRFPDDYFKAGSGATRILVDSTFGCDKLKVIVSDTLNHCLLIHDMATQSSWKVCHPTMANDPKYSNYTYQNFTLTDFTAGVYSIAFTPPLGRSRTRFLMYSSYSGVTTYAVPVSIIYKKRLWTQGLSVWRPSRIFYRRKKSLVQPRRFFNNNFGNEGKDVRFINVDRYFTTVGSDPTHRNQFCDIDPERKLYFCVLPFDGTIYGWKLTEPFSRRRTIVQNMDTLVNGATLRVLKSPHGQNEVVVSTSPIIVSRSFD